MPKLSTPAPVQLNTSYSQVEMENFMLQDEQEILHTVREILDELMREPSESSIKKILDHAKLI